MHFFCSVAKGQLQVHGHRHLPYSLQPNLCHPVFFPKAVYRIIDRFGCIAPIFLVPIQFNTTNTLGYTDKVIAVGMFKAPLIIVFK